MMSDSPGPQVVAMVRIVEHGAAAPLVVQGPYGDFVESEGMNKPLALAAERHLSVPTRKSKSVGRRCPLAASCRSSSGATGPRVTPPRA